jgi:hypothetical protein
MDALVPRDGNGIRRRKRIGELFYYKSRLPPQTVMSIRPI